VGSGMRLTEFSFVRETLVNLAIKIHDTFRNEVMSTERGWFEVFQWLYLCLQRYYAL
jgi:hypothetical protein